MLDDSGYVKLIDFGLSVENVAKNDPLMSVCGSPAYMSPEIAAEVPYSRKVDSWNLGTFLYEMLTGSPPFPGPSRE
jgi:p70 ribosomal S6 kinase